MMENGPPPSGRDLRLTVVALAIAMAVGVLLFSGSIPGLKPNFSQPSTVSVEGQPYFWTDYTVPWPIPPSNTSSPTTVLFHNASFSIWVSSWYEVTPGYVHGNGSEPTGTTFDFTLGGPQTNGTYTSLYLSPDRTVGAMWNGSSWSVELLVLDNATA